MARENSRAWRYNEASATCGSTYAGACFMVRDHRAATRGKRRSWVILVFGVSHSSGIFLWLWSPISSINVQQFDPVAFGWRRHGTAVCSSQHRVVVSLYAPGLG